MNSQRNMEFKHHQVILMLDSHKIAASVDSVEKNTCVRTVLTISSVELEIQLIILPEDLWQLQQMQQPGNFIRLEHLTVVLDIILTILTHASSLELTQMVLGLSVILGAPIGECKAISLYKQVIVVELQTMCTFHLPAEIVYLHYHIK